MSEDGLSWSGFSADDFIDELEASSAKTRRDAKVVLRAGAKEIMAASQQMCPVDEGNLEEAHHIEELRLSEDYMELEIDVSGFVGNRDVDEYAMIMHEAFYDLGPLSQLKNERNPPNRSVGRKYLERAGDQLEEKIGDQIADTLMGDK